MRLLSLVGGGIQVYEERCGRWIGAWIPQPEIATPAGIRQVFPLYTRPAHVKWDREALRSLVSLRHHRPRALEILAVDYRESRRRQVRIRGRSECGASVAMSIGGRWKRESN